MPAPSETLDDMVKRSGLPLAELAKRAGYSKRTLDRVRWGDVDLSERMRRNLESAIELAKTPQLVRELPGVTKEELAEGSDGPARYDGDSGSATYGQSPPIPLPPGMRGRFVPLLSIAQAGEWDAFHDDNGWKGDCVFAFNVDDRHAFAIKVAGNSMDSGEGRRSDLFEGDVVICSPSAGVKPGSAAVVRTQSGQAFVKFWNRRGDTAVLESANPGHKPFRVPMSEIAGAWPIVQTIRSGMIQRQL